jgi:hypothetical protein
LPPTSTTAASSQYSVLPPYLKLLRSGLLARFHNCCRSTSAASSLDANTPGRHRPSALDFTPRLMRRLDSRSPAARSPPSPP